jgi:hypothetical protein
MLSPSQPLLQHPPLIFKNVSSHPAQSAFFSTLTRDTDLQNAPVYPREGNRGGGVKPEALQRGHVYPGGPGPHVGSESTRCRLGRRLLPCKSRSDFSHAQRRKLGSRSCPTPRRKQFKSTHSTVTKPRYIKTRGVGLGFSPVHPFHHSSPHHARILMSST